jgi:methylated-DNA-protein-cysteine methyltransferase-like protein
MRPRTGPMAALNTPARDGMSLSHDLIYRAVSRIPEGRVATYGQIARLAGAPGRARQVGYALAALRDPGPVPWHRVVNARGEVSRRADPGYEDYQRILLEGEGIEFDAQGRIALARFQWRPGRRAT